MSQKYNVLGIAALALIMASAWGCKGKLPLLSSIAQAVPQMADNIIDNCEDGNTLLNPNLRGAPAGSWANWGTTGQTVLNTNAFMVPNTVMGGVNTTENVIHVLGTVTDPANATYPEAALQLRFNVSPYFNMSSFSGIKYKIRIGAGDNATKRRMKIWAAQTVPAGNGGICTPVADCWNHFGYFYSFGSTVPLALARDTWYDMSHTWADLRREDYWGGVVTPTTFSGIHLEQILGIDWAFSRDNDFGTSNVDYWLDEIEFF